MLPSVRTSGLFRQSAPEIGNRRVNRLFWRPCPAVIEFGRRCVLTPHTNANDAGSFRIAYSAILKRRDRPHLCIAPRSGLRLGCKPRCHRSHRIRGDWLMHPMDRVAPFGHVRLAVPFRPGVPEDLPSQLVQAVSGVPFRTLHSNWSWWSKFSLKTCHAKCSRRSSSPRSPWGPAGPCNPAAPWTPWTGSPAAPGGP
jgi:hypothetical protein